MFRSSQNDIDNWTTNRVLSSQATTRPEKIAIEMIGGVRLSYGELWNRTRAVAAGLQQQDVKAGDTVAVMLTNCLEFCETWLACNCIGAVLAPLNTQLRGKVLTHTLNLCESKVAVISGTLLPHLEDIADTLPDLKKVFVVSSEPSLGRSPTWPILPFEALYSDADAVREHTVRFDDLACLMLTSGTTGPSKAVMMPHAHCYLFGLGVIENLDLGPEDSYYITLPLFHCNALMMQLYSCLIVGARAVIRESFSASNWIKDIHETRATHTNLLGAIADFVWQQGPSKFDTDHCLRVLLAVPASPIYVQRFHDRYEIPHIVECYGMSEVNIPIYTPLSATRPKSCGIVYEPYFEVRIADSETDQSCAIGQLGEIQVRPKQAFGFMSGYYNAPEKTVQAWRNLWFHTGDSGHIDEEGYIYFNDRIKDCIRRYGENISAYEVEETILDFPGVTDCAAIAVDSAIPGGEDEVMIVIVANSDLVLEDLADFCRQKLPRFSVPSYIRLADASDIPRTATNKIVKAELRKIGVTTDTFVLQPERNMNKAC